MQGQHEVLDTIRGLPRGSDFAEKIQATIDKSQKLGRPFFVLLLQIENLEKYSKRHPRYVTLNLMKELYQSLRHSVHSSQFIGSFQNGFGMVFDAVDVGLADNVGRRLASLAMKVIREGRYNDIASRWTDILQQFLFPGKPALIYPRIGWAVYPRDGLDATQIVRRGLYHMKELNR